MIKINQYKEAKKELKAINEKQKQTEERLNKQLSQVTDKYYKLEKQLRDNKYKEENKIEKEKEKETKRFEAMKEKHTPIITEYQMVIELMGVIEHNKNYSLSELQVYYYDYIKDEKAGYIKSSDKVRFYYEPIDVLADDDFKKIYLYITKNRKPKNCFSLIAVGNTIFNEKIIKIPYSYGLDAHTGYSNIQIVIKDLPNEKDLKDYLERNKKRILKDFLEEHKKVVVKYEEVLKKTEDSKEWKIAYLESQKYYYENCYSGGTETEEYKKVIEDLKGLGVGINE